MNQLLIWQVPLWYDGEVYAYSLVDEDDFSWLSQRRCRTHRLSWVDPSPGYALVYFEGRMQAIHRLVLGLRYGDGKVVHHLNHDRLDNRKENLAVCADSSEHFSRFEHPQLGAARR